VTTLMQEAQRQGLGRFQVRLLKGSGGTATGLVEINDTNGPTRPSRAPQLTVTYFWQPAAGVAMDEETAQAANGRL